MLGLQDYKVDTGAKNEREEPVVKVLRAGLLAGYIRQALRKFAQSAEREIGPEHFPYIDGIDQQTENKRRGYSNNNAVRGYLLPFARAAWEDVGRRDGTFPFEHDFYVKLWQLQDSPTIGADYILLDEDQDTAPVFADVIRRQTSSLLVLVGDENQAIYEWRGACNASKLFPDAPVRRLTQSFRFGQSVADVANAVLGELDGGTELRMRGVGIPSRVLLGSDKISGLDGETDRADQYVGKVCYLYRTNAGAVGSLLQENGRGRRGCLIGKIDEVLSFVEGALDLQRGRRTGNPELAVFESWKEVQKYVKEDPDGEDLKLMVRLVDDFGAENIIRALKNMPEERYADFVASTAHKSKGREWDTVVLGADFPPACDMADPDRRLLYVAATRAKYILDLTQCTPFHEYTDREGNVTKGILVTFTQGNPERGQLADWLAARSAATAAAAAPPASPGPSPAVPAQDAAVPRVGPANGVPAAQAEPPPAPSGEAIRAMVAATEERVVTYAKLPNSSEWGMWASAEIRPGEVVEIRTRSGAIKREKVGQIVLVAPKKWLATIAR